MKTTPPEHIRDLIGRIARLNAADEWADDLNPTQGAALSYLARANRFSRSPSQVAEFLATTRGTVSQTLKALERKGLIRKIRSEADRRSISYAVTAEGLSTLKRSTVIDEVLDSLPAASQKTLANGLQSLVRTALKTRGMRPFGQCKNCTYHQKKGAGGYCTLLNELLKPEETLQICHEQLEKS